MRRRGRRRVGREEGVWRGGAASATLVNRCVNGTVELSSRGHSRSTPSR